MSSDNRLVFTKDNLDLYLKELGKEFRRLNGKTTPAEIVLIGGAAILASYGFRESTTDVDAVINASSAMKDAINRVGDKYNLPTGWLNSDFTKTSSFSTKLIEVSIYYKTFSNVLSVRTVSAEYLIAMKLKAGRRYKNDLSDIIGILHEHKQQKNPLSFERVETAVTKLYGGWDSIPKSSIVLIQAAFRDENYDIGYNEVLKEEREAKDTLIEFNKDYPDALTASNIDDILATIKAKNDEKKT